ncbi:MAG: discoidin domain-containing protein [Armatimonadetes bacterium]|nr:discoidin domain-containing protein [Armatimonadota bacterium]
MFLGIALAALLPFAGPADLQPIEDTYVDADVPEFNLGRDGLLVGGVKTALLLRFPGLEWIPSGQQVDSAMLTLHLLDQSEVKLKSVKRVLVPWNEGAGQRAPIARPGQPLFPKGGATWLNSSGTAKWHGAGGSSDQDAVPISGVTALTEGSSVRFVGLGPALEEMRKDPAHNYGLRIEFEGSCVFYSSEGQGPGPELTLTTKNAGNGARLVILGMELEQDGKWTAKIQNTGDAPATGWSSEFKIGDRNLGQDASQRSLAPGDTVSVTTKDAILANAPDPRNDKLTLNVRAAGSDSAGTSMAVSISGLPVKFALSPAAQALVDKERGDEPVDKFYQRIIAAVNEGVFAQSKASFAPEGCLERLRLVSGDSPALIVHGDFTALGKTDAFHSLLKDTVRAVSPLSGKWTNPADAPATPDVSIGWIGDTRDDSAWPSALMLPNYPWGEPRGTQAPLPARGLLGRAEVAAINSLVGKPLAERGAYSPKLPQLVVLAIVDGAGNPISGADVEVFPMADGQLQMTALYKAKSNDKGYVYLTAQGGATLFGTLKPDGTNSFALVRVTSNFVTENDWLSATSLVSEAARGNLGAAFLELKFLLPGGPINETEDLAQSKIVTDSLQRFPAELTSLVDGNNDTSVSLQPGDAAPSWVEIDLGRDRLIAAVEIETTGGIWDRFEIATGKTGQKSGETNPWIVEPAGPLRLLERGKKSGTHDVLTYVSTPVRSRYVRLIVKQGGKVNVAAIRVRTLQQN